jgi:glycosyltransferase involved in cell wall biosynthesis
MRRLFYSYPEPLPAPNARTVNVVKSCAAFAEYFDVTLVTMPNTKSRLEIEAAYGVDFSRLEILRLPRKFLGIDSTAIYHWYLRKKISPNRPAIVYVRHLKTACALLRRKPPGITVIYECHEILHQTSSKSSKHSQIRAQEQFVFEKADGLVFTTETLRDDVNELFRLRSTSNQIILPHGFDAPGEISAKDFFQISEVFYVGSLQAWKGVNELVAAMQSVPSPVQLHLVGRSDPDILNSLQALAGQHDVAERVHFHPPISHHEAIQLLQSRARLCVLPNSSSPRERYTCPLKLFEYMGTNNIIIYSDIPSIRSITSQRPMGVAVPPGNALALGRAIAAVCENPPAYQHLAANAGQLVRKFSWQSRAHRLSEFIEQLPSAA